MNEVPKRAPVLEVFEAVVWEMCIEETEEVIEDIVVGNDVRPLFETHILYGDAIPTAHSLPTKSVPSSASMYLRTAPDT